MLQRFSAAFDCLKQHTIHSIRELNKSIIYCEIADTITLKNYLYFISNSRNRFKFKNNCLALVKLVAAAHSLQCSLDSRLITFRSLKSWIHFLASMKHFFQPFHNFLSIWKAHENKRHLCRQHAQHWSLYFRNISHSFFWQCWAFDYDTSFRNIIFVHEEMSQSQWW